MKHSNFQKFCQNHWTLPCIISHCISWSWTRQVFLLGMLIWYCIIYQRLGWAQTLSRAQEIKIKPLLSGVPDLHGSLFNLPIGPDLASELGKKNVFSLKIFLCVIICIQCHTNGKSILNKKKQKYSTVDAAGSLFYLRINT